MLRPEQKISIGIPAFNEGGNIRKLLKSVLSQEQKNFNLLEIIVVSDGSTDNTVHEVKSIKNNKIKLIINRQRKGQAEAQNKITGMFRGDVLVLLNADVLPADSNFLVALIKPLKDSRVGMTGAKIIPQKATTDFERTINFSISLKDSMFEKWNHGNNIYLCSGRGRAFSRTFAKEIKWGTSLSEDAYSYLLCKRNRHEFVYVKDAKLIFKSPDNFKDHIRQSARFMKGQEILEKYFSKMFIKDNYSIPFTYKISIFHNYLFSQPALLIKYLLIFLSIKVNPRKKLYANSKWKISETSKKLNINT